MSKVIEKNTKAKIALIIIAIVLLLTTWYCIRIQGITMTEEQENPEMLNEVDMQMDEEIENSENEINYPSQSFLSNEIPNITVEATAEEGVFPEGTIMKATAVSTNQKEEIKERINDSDSITENNEKVVDIVAVDITFYHDGKEIQPKDGKKVNVNIITTNNILGQNHKAVHIEDSGEVEEIKDANVSSKEASIEAKSFSIYAIIGTDYTDPNVNPTARYRYEFYVNNSRIYYQTVKNGDKLVEPSIPSWANYTNKTFAGWQIEGETGYIDFNEEISNTQTTDTTFRVNAVFVDQYKVIFYSDEAKTSVLQTITAGNGMAVSLENEVVANTETTQFLGWYDATDGTQTIIDSVTINNTNVELLPKIQTDITWVHFNSLGGTYIESQFIIPGTAAEEPTAPTKIGYTFKGWYTSQASAENLVAADKFNFTTTIDSTMTLYAGWQAQSVPYKVIYWVENSDDDGYSVKEVVNKTGITGTYATWDARNYPNYHINGTGYVCTNSEFGFTIEPDNPSTNVPVIIKGDGTTIQNVYYSQQTYIVQVIMEDGVIKESFPIKHYQDMTPIMQASIQHGRLSGYHNGIRCNETPINTNLEWNADFMGDDWMHDINYPIGIEISPSVWNRSWSDGYILKFRKVRRNRACFMTADIVYLEQLDDSYHDPNRTYLDTPIEKFGRVFDSYIIFDNWKRHVGMTESQAMKMDINGTMNIGVGDTLYTGPAGQVSFPFPADGSPLKIYSIRTKKNVRFITNDGNPDIVYNDIPFGKNISTLRPETYIKGSTSKIIDGKEYIFDGWYDNELCEGDECTFDNLYMPAKNLSFFAKWKVKSHTVTFDANGGTYTGPPSVNVDYGDTVAKPEDPTKDGYIFVGWKRANGHFFNFNDLITSDITLTAQYQALSECYKVAYDAGSDGEFTLTDTNYYLDGANAIIIGTPTVTNNNKIFAGWKIGDHDTLYKSGIFTIDATDAVLDANSNKVITLVAQYVDKPEKTTIIYNPNGGNGTVYEDTIELVNNNETKTVLSISDVGFSASNIFDRFVCWNTAPDGTGLSFYPGETVAVNNTDDLGRTLYAIWRPDVVINKTDNSGNLITGSLFKITRGSQVIYIGDTASTSAEWNTLYGDIADGTADGILTFSNLLYSTNTSNPEYVYELEEIVAPDGYIKLDVPIRFCITQDNGIYIINSSEVSNAVTVSVDGSTISVRNIQVLVLPKTGGIGVNIYYIIGFSLMLTAGIVVYYNNKKSLVVVKQEEKN